MTFDDFFERDWLNVMPKIRKPIIAAVRGMAFGGGFELAMMCDIIFSTPETRFGFPEIKLGIIPGAGGTQWAPKLAGKSKAMEMILTGEPILGEDALKWHLVSRLYPKDKVVEEALKCAAKIA